MLWSERNHCLPKNIRNQGRQESKNIKVIHILKTESGSTGCSVNQPIIEQRSDVGFIYFIWSIPD